MRPRLRAGVVALMAAALVCSLPLSAPAVAEPDVPGREQARKVLAEVHELLDPPPALRAGEVLPRRDVTLAVRDLRRALPALSASERTAARSLLGGFASPSANCGGGLLGGKVVQTAHFCVRYTSGIGGSATTDGWAQTTAVVLEEVYAAEVGRLGFRPPLPDGDGFFDVELKDTGSAGYYGACFATQAPHSTSACELDNDFAIAQFGAPPLQSLRATAAHEFFHAVQFGYDVLEDTWLMEGSAVWAEEQVYPTLNDYLQYLEYSAIRRPRVPTDYAGDFGTRDGLHRYGAVLFWSFLSERFGGPPLIRRVWEYADGAHSARYSLQAVTAALAERGVAFADAYALFGVWNTLPPGTYADRGLYPAPAWWQVHTLKRKRRTTGSQAVLLDHLTNAAMVLRPAWKLPRRTKVRIQVSGPSLVRMPRAVVQIHKRNGAVAVRSIGLDGNGEGRRRVSFDPRKVDSVVVTLSNASTRQVSCGSDRSARFSCAGFSGDDGQPFAVRATLRFPRR